MDIVLSEKERANLETEASRRGLSPEELLRLLVSKQKSRETNGSNRRKSNGWCSRRREYLTLEGKVAGEQPLPKPPVRRRKKD